jgi:hypothetical protein
MAGTLAPSLPLRRNLCPPYDTITRSLVAKEAVRRPPKAV